MEEFVDRGWPPDTGAVVVDELDSMLYKLAADLHLDLTPWLPPPLEAALDAPGPGAEPDSDQALGLLLASDPVLRLT